MYWTLENQYFPGTVNSIESNGFRVIQYDDNDIETLNLNDEKWDFELPTTLNSAYSGFSTALKSNEEEVLSDMVEALGNRPFLRHHAQDLSLIHI